LITAPTVNASTSIKYPQEIRLKLSNIAVQFVHPETAAQRARSLPCRYTRRTRPVRSRDSCSLRELPREPFMSLSAGSY
jgi:hypothetical protein